MNSTPILSYSVYIGASLVFALVILYWILYTRRLKTPPNTGTNEGIAIPTVKKERAGRSGTI